MKMRLRWGDSSDWSLPVRNDKHNRKTGTRGVFLGEVRSLVPILNLMVSLITS